MNFWGKTLGQFSCQKRRLRCTYKTILYPCFHVRVKKKKERKGKSVLHLKNKNLLLIANLKITAKKNSINGIIIHYKFKNFSFMIIYTLLITNVWHQIGF